MRRAGMRIAAPVRGFRTDRALRRTTSKVPKPTSFTFSPFFSERETFSMREPSTRSTSALVSPESLATRPTTSARFMASGGFLGLGFEQLLGLLEDHVSSGGRALFVLDRFHGHARLHAVAVDRRALRRRGLRHRDEQAAFGERDELLQRRAAEAPFTHDGRPAGGP